MSPRIGFAAHRAERRGLHGPNPFRPPLEQRRRSPEDRRRRPGVAILPTFLVGPDIEAGRFVSVLTRFAKPDLAFRSWRPPAVPERTRTVAKERICPIRQTVWQSPLVARC